ncbi:MAG: hypothetical protein QW491_13825 [Thermoproteota archaeon]
MEVALFGFYGLENKIKSPSNMKIHSIGPFEGNLISARRIYDFDVLIERELYTQELKDHSFFFNAKGLMFLFCESDPSYYLNAIKLLEEGIEWEATLAWSKKSYYTQYFSVICSGGRTIKPTPKAGVLSSIIRKIDWYQYFFMNYPKDSIVLAENRACQTVALRVPLFDGEIILLPGNPYRKNLEYYLPIIQSLLEVLPKLKRLSEEELPPPEWISSYIFPKERELLNKKTEIDEQLKIFRVRKELLYAYGDRLEEVAGLPLGRFGFTIESLPKGEYADFILRVGDKQVAAVEVTSSTKQIAINELRQLIRFLVDCETENRSIKGILIGNHFYEKPPEERGEPFTKDVLSAAAKHNICLVTTVELFKVLQKLDEEKVKPEEIRDKLLNTVGIYIF